MAVLEFILIVLLQFEGVSGGRLYHRVGDDAVLPCSSGGSLSSCSGLGWFYIRDDDSRWVVQNGIVLPISPQAARLSLSRNCSLIINNITAEDAGRYTCRLGGSRSNTDEYLNVLSISPSDVGPTEDGDVTLHCSLRRYVSYCPENSLLWVDETGTHF
ncbi:leucine-rich repeat-containing protein 4B [Kryptolebias marmoratus]|uniref:leucine-rich repeat-containing protein 4B n=1 Tax=Kryptolebias marmoratus TaxID=37003 RepID=UPI000D530076|nr:leucine-rich repeat-containing protein 4B [Kryptolebias marmoratus]